jgi:hypothetical protein
MERKLTALIFTLLFSNVSVFAQTIKPFISARVDTTNFQVKKIYHLYSNYLNSKPDSCYANSNWNEKEYVYYLKQNSIPIDRSANAMFGQNFKRFIKYYKPTILQIDSIEKNLYQVKTLFKSNSTEADSLGDAISYITNIYASRNENGVFKLQNTISKRTEDWKKYNYKFISYIVSPKCNFNKEEAEKAVDFCEKLAEKFGLKILPFKYYVLPNTDEFGKLLNFEYWTYYIGAQTNKPLREIFTSYGNENYPHELVHMMFPSRNNNEYTPNIVQEGVATWLGGPKLGTSYKQALEEVSKTLKTYQNPTFKDIMSYKIRNKFDSNIFYVTGAVLCEMVYKKTGKEGILKIYNSTEATLDKTLEEIFQKPLTDIHKQVIEQILGENE